MKLAFLEAEFSKDDVDEIANKSMIELRTWRERCLMVEAQLSLLRRLVHGQIDILQAKSIEEDVEVGNVLRAVPDVFGSGAQSQGRYRSVEIENPDNGLAEELSDAVKGMDLGSLLELPIEQRVEVTSKLWALEERVSSLRRTMQSIVDSIQSEVGMRYRNGEVSFPAGALT